MKRPSQYPGIRLERIHPSPKYYSKGKRSLLVAGDAFTPIGVERAPDKIETGGGEGDQGRPLGAAFLSVGPANSPARSLRAYLRRRMEQPITATEAEPRFSGAVRVLLGVVLAVGSWAVVLGGAWLAIRYLTH